MNIHEPQQSCPKVTACTVATSYGKVTMWRASNNQREHPGKGHGATFPNWWMMSYMMYIMNLAIVKLQAKIKMYKKRSCLMF